jgi:hypothetical protein
MEVSSEWVEVLENEIQLQPVIKFHGLRAKDYVMVNLDKDVSKCFAISNFIPGVTLSKMPPDRVVELAKRLLDLVSGLHFKTVNRSFGYLRDIHKKSVDTGFGIFCTKYLLADIQRDGIPVNKSVKKGLDKAIAYLDQIKLFCLCHCDITLRNTLLDGGAIVLIDWASARWSHPAQDLAHILFWLLEYGRLETVESQYWRVSREYLSLGFELEYTLPYFLAERYIEYGRLKGGWYIQKGLRILEEFGSGLGFQEIVKLE